VPEALIENAATVTMTSAPTAASAQRRRERAIAAKYRGGVAWRIVLEAAWGFGLWVGMIVAAVYGIVPYWVACLVNGWVAYLTYMPLHEATHCNIMGERRELRWLNELIGWISSVPMWFSYQAHVPSHMKHHAFTNDPARDPDHIVAGPFTHLFAVNLRFAVLQFAYPILGVLRIQSGPIVEWLRRGLGEVVPDEYEIRAQFRFLAACLAVFLGLSLAGYPKEAVLLWWLPSRIGFFVVTAVFAWLPHLPHRELGRYRNTRVTLFPLSKAICRGHDRHILHHMFPRVPHYRLPRMFSEMRPLLEEQGVRIEGSLAGPGAPPVGLRWPSDAAQARG
jgi:beta-carotene hydroxylase